MTAAAAASAKGELVFRGPLYEDAPLLDKLLLLADEEEGALVVRVVELGVLEGFVLVPAEPGLECGGEDEPGDEALASRDEDKELRWVLPVGFARVFGEADAIEDVEEYRRCEDKRDEPGVVEDVKSEITGDGEEEEEDDDEGGAGAIGGRSICLGSCCWLEVKLLVLEINWEFGLAGPVVDTAASNERKEPVFTLPKEVGEEEEEEEESGITEGVELVDELL